MQSILKAYATLEAARPSSGFRPQTPEEWLQLQKAFEKLGYLTFRNSGCSKQQAKKLAKQIYGGESGKILLEIGFKDDHNE